MTKKLVIIGFILAVTAPALAQIPYQVGGFKLGGSIGDVTGQVKMETAIPIRYQAYLSEVEIEDTPLFKSGLITYGTCQDAGRIVRIKLKYADSSETFFNQLLDRIKVRFGKPDEWRGDSFGIVKAWKWSFRGQAGNRISLTLQHNTRDDEEKKGNAIKMTMHNLVEDERRCYEKKEQSRRAADSVSKTAQPGSQKIDWDLLVPK
jgi:hypothetical protein